jgi:hypothetical protein
LRRFTSPNPVLRSDDQTHLAYELVSLAAASQVGIDKMRRSTPRAARYRHAEGDGLARMLQLNGDAKGIELPAAGGGFVFMDVTLPKGAAIPKSLKHRFKIGVANAPGAGAAGDHDPAPPPPQELSFVGDPLPVGAPAVVVAPPLKGKHWVMGGGCCATAITASLPLNGPVHVLSVSYRLRAAERQEHVIDGPMKLSSCLFGDDLFRRRQHGGTDGTPSGAAAARRRHDTNGGGQSCRRRYRQTASPSMRIYSQAA